MPLIYYLSAYSPVIPLTISVLKYKSIKPDYKYLVYFIAFAVFTEISVFTAAKFGLKSSLPLMHFYVPIEFVFFALFYRNQLTNKIQKKFVLFVVPAYLIFWTISILFIQTPENYPSVSRSVSTLFIVLFSIFYFQKVMIESKVEKLSSEPMIWINTAVLIYFSANLFYHAFFRLIIQVSVEFLTYTVYFFQGLNLLFYLLVAVGFLKVSQKQDGKLSF